MLKLETPKVKLAVTGAVVLVGAGVAALLLNQGKDKDLEPPKLPAAKKPIVVINAERLYEIAANYTPPVSPEKFAVFKEKLEAHANDIYTSQFHSIVGPPEQSEAMLADRNQGIASMLKDLLPIIGVDEHFDALSLDSDSYHAMHRIFRQFTAANGEHLMMVQESRIAGRAFFSFGLESPTGKTLTVQGKDLSIPGLLENIPDQSVNLCTTSVSHFGFTRHDDGTVNFEKKHIASGLYYPQTNTASVFVDPRFINGGDEELEFRAEYQQAAAFSWKGFSYSSPESDYQSTAVHEALSKALNGADVKLQEIEYKGKQYSTADVHEFLSNFVDLKASKESFQTIYEAALPATVEVMSEYGLLGDIFENVAANFISSATNILVIDNQSALYRAIEIESKGKQEDIDRNLDNFRTAVEGNQASVALHSFFNSIGPNTRELVIPEFYKKVKAEFDKVLELVVAE